MGNIIAGLIEEKFLDKNIQNANIKELKINYKIVEELEIKTLKDLRIGAK